MSEDKMRDIIKRIKDRRQELGYSFQDLANLTGMSKSTLQRYETGAIKNIPLDKLKVLASALEVAPEWIMGWADDVRMNITYEKLEAVPTEEELRLLKAYRKLNEEGKEKVRDYVDDLTASDKYIKNNSYRLAEKA